MLHKTLISSILIVLISTFSLLSQDSPLSKRKLSKQKVFYNLEEALISPEKVYRLNLDGSTSEGEMLKSIPKDINKFSNLQELVLSNNNITELPSELFEIKNLQILNLSYNPIKELPSEIKELKNLKDIDLNFCHLKTIPVELFSIKTLEKVNLFANHISRFPDGIEVNSNILYLNILRNGMSMQVKEKLKLLFPEADFGEQKKPKK